MPRTQPHLSSSLGDKERPGSNLDRVHSWKPRRHWRRRSPAGDSVERNLQLFCASRHLEVKGVHINRIALPVDRLAACGNLQTGEIGYRPAGAMISRNPFWINQSQRTRLCRNRDSRVKNISRRVAQIDRQLDRLRQSDTRKQYCGSRYAGNK